LLFGIIMLCELNLSTSTLFDIIASVIYLAVVLLIISFIVVAKLRGLYETWLILNF
jgi:hypothetical protein